MSEGPSLEQPSNSYRYTEATRFEDVAVNKSTTWYAVRPQSIAWDRLLDLIGVTALPVLWPARGVPQCDDPDCPDNPVLGGGVSAGDCRGTGSSASYASGAPCLTGKERGQS